MRIAIVFVKLASDSRSTNIVRALGLLDEAARSDPAPDLIVIPPGCDHVRQRRHILSRAMVEMLQAALAAKAREWGVLVAVGLRRRTPHGTEDVGVLLDADGDQRLVCRPGDRPEIAQDTLLGPVHLCCDAEDLVAASTVESWPAAHVTVVLAQPDADGAASKNDQRKCDTIARGTHSCAILARGPTADDTQSGTVRCCHPSRLGVARKLPGGRVITADISSARSTSAADIVKP